MEQAFKVLLIRWSDAKQITLSANYENHFLLEVTSKRISSYTYRKVVGMEGEHL